MTQGPRDLETHIAALDLLDYHGVDWKRVQRTAYLIHQHLHYEYPGPITDLHQRLMVIPPAIHNDQRCVVHHLEVSAPDVETISSYDEFDNYVLNLFVPHVEKSIDFEVWVIVERHAQQHPYMLPASTLTDARYLQPSPLTQPDDALRQHAQRLLAEGLQGAELARRINTWVYQQLSYEHDVTNIHTTSAQALALGKGVCQDYAHIMLALCHLCGLPARYVSGHLLGEGGTHAWVEVLLPSTEQASAAIALPLDPTHGRETGLSYLTVAVGRDYYDVAPTSGTFRAPYRGELSASKLVGLTHFEYAGE
jgi:transglutaminase-like putative cysteine protease